MIEETDSRSSERINYKPLKKNEKGKLKSFIENKYLSKTGFTFVFKVWIRLDAIIFVKKKSNLFKIRCSHSCEVRDFVVVAIGGLFPVTLVLFFKNNRNITLRRNYF